MMNIYRTYPKIIGTLVSLTVLFGSYSLYVWFQSTKIAVPTPEPVGLMRFSDVYRVADSTRDYSKGAKIITDIETIPEFRQVFFESGVPIPTNESVSHELAKVTDFSQFKTPSSTEHVFNTSYYVGNFEVLPGKTLQSWLFSAERTATANLIQTALADIRAGAVTIQDLYDVAAPSTYLFGVASSSPVYFSTPSFPSLTMSEVAITALLMSKLDAPRARFYEAQARRYASEVYATSAHFETDITYAIKLAELYFKEMEQNNEYRVLFAAAAAEWGEEDYALPTTFSPVSFPLFNFAYFPYESNRKITNVINYDYRISYTEEALNGSLRLSLIDTRLPNPSVRLYESKLDSATAQVVPVELELQQGIDGRSREAVGFAFYKDVTGDTFSFVAGKKGDNGKLFASGSVSAYQSKQGIVTKTVVGGSLLDTITGQSQPILTEKELIFEDSHQDGETDIVRVAFQSMEAVPTIIATGTAPCVVNDDILLFVSSGTKVVGKKIDSNQALTVSGITVAEGGLVTRQLRYFPEQNILAVMDTSVDKQLVPQTTVYLYALAEEEGGVVADRRYQFTVEDLLVQTVALSPGGRYVALTASEAVGGRLPKVLIYDTFDGIIKKEVDLRPFLTSMLRLDDWLPK